MSDKGIEKVLKFNKNDVRLEIKKRAIAQRPELQSQMSNKIITEIRSI